MARANRYYQPGLIWHITHRCHKREFLLKFIKDKQMWSRWVLASKRQFGLCILNYVITSNHIHLLILDRNQNADQTISRSLQLAAGRVAQEYNKRKKRSGAFWEDRYHATAIETGDHFINCLTYIDLNMVRAKVVGHPGDWPFGGYYELQQSRERFRNQLVDWRTLSLLLGIKSLESLRDARAEWVEKKCLAGKLERDAKWTENVAVGSREYTEKIMEKLGRKMKREEEQGGGAIYPLRGGGPA
jgi:REP element-mobilizing transposase RayT